MRPEDEKRVEAIKAKAISVVQKPESTPTEEETSLSEAIFELIDSKEYAQAVLEKDSLGRDDLAINLAEGKIEDKPKISDNEAVVFCIKVDQNGELTSYAIGTRSIRIDFRVEGGKGISSPKSESEVLSWAKESFKEYEAYSVDPISQATGFDDCCVSIYRRLDAQSLLKSHKSLLPHILNKLEKLLEDPAPEEEKKD